MSLKKFLMFGLVVAIMPAVAEEAADRKTATSLKYVEHELDTRQNKFGAEQNKAMEYTNAAGIVEKRAVTSDLGTSTSDTSLPMVGGVNTKLNQKQDDIDPFNDHTAVTYTGQPGGIGQKGIYETTESYADQSDNLIDAKTFNAAVKNGLDSEFICSEFKPDTDLCWVYSIHNNGMQKTYVSATGTSVQDGTPTPTNPIDPIFYHQGNMILRRVGDYADSYDAATHKITRHVGEMVLDGTESWAVYDTRNGFLLRIADMIQSNYGDYLCSHAIAVHDGVLYGIRWGANDKFLMWCQITTNLPISDLSQWKSWLAEQYAAGTPVTIWYPLATPTEEDWTDTTYNDSVYIPQNQ